MIREQLSKIIEEKMGYEPSEIEFDKKISDMNIDSIDLVELIMTIEEEFQIEFADEELDEIETLSDIVSLIESKN